MIRGFFCPITQDWSLFPHIIILWTQSINYSSSCTQRSFHSWLWILFAVQTVALGWKHSFVPWGVKSCSLQGEITFWSLSFPSVISFYTPYKYRNITQNSNQDYIISGQIHVRCIACVLCLPRILFLFLLDCKIINIWERGGASYSTAGFQ